MTYPDGSAARADSGLHADLVLLNGRILSLDAHNTEAQAIALRGDRILAVGDNREIEALAGARTERVDLAGRVALPGLVDCHVHLASNAGAAHTVECRDLHDAGVRSISDILHRLRERALQTPLGQWIVGRGSPLAEYRLEERRRPTRNELDEFVPDHPAYVYFGAHVLVCNSRAMQEKHISRDTPDPQGGVVVKDEDGEPTGELRERAQFLVKVIEPSLGPEDLAEGIRAELLKCAARGVTTVHDIVVSKRELLAYQLLDRAGRMPIRARPLIRVIESRFSKESLLDLGFVHGFGSDMLKLGGVKMSIDGGFSGKNAAFSEPLEEEGEKSFSLVRILQDELDETIWRYHELGMRCCVHAIGDAAADMALEAFEKALTRLPRKDHRHRVEHLGNWLMSPERMERTRRLGILPVPNPPFMYHTGDALLSMLGKRRMQDAFPFRRLWDSGIPLTFGSDALGWHPVDVLRDLGTAVSRKTMEGTVIAPEQALSLHEAFRAVTANAAYADFAEERIGTLESGKLADVIVLGEDPFRFPPEQFKQLPVDLTIAAGKVVYSRSET